MSELIETVQRLGFWFNIGKKDTKMKTLNELQSLLAKAEANYLSCGCKVYREEILDIKAQIKALEDSVKKG